MAEDFQPFNDEESDDDSVDSLNAEINEFYIMYEQIKNRIRGEDKHFYERWKAGGFLIDDNIVSMYPKLSDIA